MKYTFCIVEKLFVSGAVLFVFKIVQYVLKKNTKRSNESHLLILLSIMHKDVRYKNVRDLIKAKSITEFRQIFDSIPKSVIARALGMNTSRIDKFIEHPEELRHKHIKTISSLLDIPCSVLIQLFDKDFS